METSYKEKYEDILARLAKAKNDNEVCDERFCCVINEIIPELAESEQKPNPCDGCVNRKGCVNCENGELRETKQKPADKVEPKFKVGDKIYLKPEYRMPDDDTPIANTVKEIRRIDDKHYRFDGSYIFIEDQDKYELVEQKPKENKGNIGGISANSAWSEDDEEILDSIIGDIYNADTLIGGKETASNKCSWLKSLKERIGGKV